MAPKRHYNFDPSRLEDAIRTRLRSARLAKGLTPEELDVLIAEKPGVMRRLEAGRASLHLSRLHVIGLALDLDINKLFEGFSDLTSPMQEYYPDRPTTQEAEQFVETYLAVEEPSLRKEVSDLVLSIANSQTRKQD